MSCGLSDTLLEANRRFVPKLRSLGYSVDYEEWEGGHGWDFWDESLKRALKLFADGIKIR